MTSKEALMYLDDIAHGRKMNLNAHELKLFIEKDLEVLEILKKHFTYWHIKDSKGVVIEIYNEPVIQITEEDLKYGWYDEEDLKIKEWLENE